MSYEEFMSLLIPALFICSLWDLFRDAMKKLSEFAESEPSHQTNAAYMARFCAALFFGVMALILVLVCVNTIVYIIANAVYGNRYIFLCSTFH